MIGRLVLLLALGAVACGGTDAGAPAQTAAVPPAAPPGPTAGDVELAEITAEWPDELYERCGGSVRDALGARDLVQGALDGLSGGDTRVAAEIEDAKHWFAEGNRKLGEVRPLLTAKQCDGTTEVVLEEAVQFYVKAGTAAMQAVRIVDQP